MNDSYSATRVQVMRTKLLQPDEYERLMKMGPLEIISNLKEYKPEIDALALKDLEDLEIIDKIIARNNDRTLAKLRGISSPRFLTTLSVFLEENDRWNLRVIAEAIAGGAQAPEMLARYGRRGKREQRQYLQARTIEELSRMANSEYPELRHHPATLAAFIDALLQHHHPSLLADKYLIDEQNLLRLLAYKRARMAPEQIMARMARGGTVPRSLLRQAAQAGTLEEALRTLRSTKYGKALVADPLRVEYELHHAVLRRIERQAGIRPLGPEVLVRYLIEKDIEGDNIRLLVKGKYLGLDEKFIREQLGT